MAYGFAKSELEPNAAEWDRTKHFPMDVYKKSAELGFGGIYVSEEWGGCGLGRLEASLIFEALSTGKFFDFKQRFYLIYLLLICIGCVGSSAYISIHNMCAWMLDVNGTQELKEQYLEKMTTFDLFSSYCLTEPDSGSDAQAMKCNAKDMGDHFVLNGSKAFISAAGSSDLYFVMCRTGEKEISCLLVPKESVGLSFGANESKLGWNVQPTRVVSFDDVKVPKSHLIGERGKGFKIALSGLDGGRLNIASCSLGGAAASLESTT